MKDSTVTTPTEPIHRRPSRRTGSIIMAAIMVAALVGWLVTAHRGTPGPDRWVMSKPLGVGAYYQGDRVVAVTTARFGQVATLTWTPTTTDEHLLLGCDVPGLPEVQWTSWLEKVRLGDTNIADSTSCPDAAKDAFVEDEPQAIDVGATNVGHPTSITARIEMNPETPTSAKPPTNGILYLAVTEAVPFDQFPLPADPHVMAVLDRSDMTDRGRDWPTVVHLGSPGDRTPVATFLGPGQPMSLTVPVGRYTFQINSQTPGLIHIAVDREPLFTAEFWDYRQQRQGYQHRAIGSGTGMVTITVSADDTTGDWFVAVIPEPPAN